MSEWGDINDLTWESPSWDRDTIKCALLPGGGVVWFDSETDKWHLDPAGANPFATWYPDDEMLREDNR